MPQPNGKPIESSNPTETFLDTLRAPYNKIVKSTFGSDTDEDYTSINPVNALRHAFTLMDADSLMMAIGKMVAFYIFRMEKRVTYLEGLILPSDTWGDLENRPKITLVFTQNNSDLKKPLISELTFRLKNKETENITTALENELKNEVNSNFPTTFLYTSGPSVYHYEDKKNGYRCNIWCNTKQDGENVVKRMLGIQDITFSDDLVKYRSGSTVRSKTTTLKGITKTIRDRKTSRGDMRLKSATLHPGSGWAPIPLVRR